MNSAPTPTPASAPAPPARHGARPSIAPILAAAAALLLVCDFVAGLRGL